MENKANADFGFNTEGWRSINSQLLDARNSMEDLIESMKDVVKNTLLQAGLEGDTANTLAERYDQDVLRTARQFVDKLDEYIATNQEAVANAENTSDEAQRIALSTGNFS